jgi:hypothetical protein
MIVMAFALFLMSMFIIRLIRENDISKNNYQTLSKGIEHLTTKNGQMYAKTGLLILDNKQISDSMKKYVKQFNIRPKNVTNIITNNASETIEVRTTLKDTLIFDTIKASHFSWQDKWTTIKYIAIGDSVKLNYASDIPITQIVYKRKVGIKFWKKRQLEQIITSDNPRVRINYSTNVIVK